MRDERIPKDVCGEARSPDKVALLLRVLKKKELYHSCHSTFGESSRETVGTICYSSDFVVSSLGLT